MRLYVSKLVLRNAFYNLLGLGLPAIVALAVIPELIEHLGSEKFGILLIIWAVVSYFGLFDLGLGRVVTQHLAAALARDDIIHIQRIVGTASAVMIALGTVGGATMFALSPVLAEKFAVPSDVAEVSAAFLWMAFSIPAIVMTSCYRGILEAIGSFALINMIRLPMGIYTFAAPLVVVMHAGPRLDIIALVLALGRVLACAVHAFFALRRAPLQKKHGTIDGQFLPKLIKTGGWLTVSNLVAPLMNYIDRFILGVIASGAAVAYYATPQELLLRIGIIPSALATVLFPLFASSSAPLDGDRDSAHVRSYSALIALLMAPITIILMIFAHPLLELWVSTEFADRAYVVLQIMAVAALASGLAQIPYTMLQAVGRADITGKLHVAELPIYIALICVLVFLYGPIGAASAWLFRVIADAGLLYHFNQRILNADQRLRS